MQVHVKTTGVLLRLATDEEVEALERARRGGAEFDLPRSHSYREPSRAPTLDEVYIVAQPFVEFERHGVDERWAGMEYHGTFVPTDDDAARATPARVNGAGQSAAAEKDTGPDSQA